MPGEPTETLLGTGAIGFGLIVAYAAYKNVSPLTLFRDTITTGRFPDIGKLPKLFKTGTTQQLVENFPTPDADAAAIGAKDKVLGDRLKAAIDAYTQAQTPSTKAEVKRLSAEARRKGFKKEADDLDRWITLIEQHPASATGSGNVIPAVQI